VLLGQECLGTWGWLTSVGGLNSSAHERGVLKDGASLAQGKESPNNTPAIPSKPANLVLQLSRAVVRVTDENGLVCHLGLNTPWVFGTRRVRWKGAGKGDC
jgi:hypothetical protein